MHYKLLGFSQDGAVRQFSFVRVGNQITPAEFAVRADILLARKFELALQELPSLCSRLLQALGDDQPSGTVFLTEADMVTYAAEKTAVAQEDAAKRALRSRRAALAAAARTNTTLPPLPLISK